MKEILSQKDYQILASIEVNMAIQNAESSKEEKKQAAIKYLQYLWKEIMDYEYIDKEQEDFMMNLAGHLYEKIQQM